MSEATFVQFRQAAAILPSAELLTAIHEDWSCQALAGQRQPAGCWSNWLILAGRGFGKTRTGAEWVHARARAWPGARIALVGGSLEEVAKVMVEGDSGLLATARSGEKMRWSSSRGELRFASGARAFAYSGERPEQLRGPQFHFAWADELAKWRSGEASWDNLRLGLRLGDLPQTVITTTPRPTALLRRIMSDPATRISRGATRENPWLAQSFRIEVERLYGGTRLGRQELEGDFMEEVEGALWSRRLIENCRGGQIMPADRDKLTRVVIGVDPPAGDSGDACGILVCGVDPDGRGHVLEDASASGLSPEGWAARVATAAAHWCADRIVAEANQGGNMVETVLRTGDRNLPVRLRHATDSKGKRAEPIAALFEQGRVTLCGSFPALEDELVGMMVAGGYEGPGRSPDRADAMVWALAELMLGRTPKARVSRL